MSRKILLSNLSSVASPKTVVLLGKIILKSHEKKSSTEDLADWLSAEVSATFSAADTNIGNYACRSLPIGVFKSYGLENEVKRHFYYHTKRPDYVLSLDHGSGTELLVGSEPYLIRRQSAAFVRLDQVREITIQPKSVAEGFVFPADFIQRSLTSYFDCITPSEFSFSIEVDLARPSNSGLISIIRSFRDLFVANEEAVPSIAMARFEDLLSSLIMDNFEHTFAQDKGTARPHSITPVQVKRAINFARDNAGHPITSNDMAAAAGVSLRSLQENFRRFLDTTPIEYLKHLRLEGARRELLESPENKKVSTIAGNWGFLHMGRFSVDYRNRFGVSPTEDLRRGPMARDRP